MTTQGRHRVMRPPGEVVGALCALVLGGVSVVTLLRILSQGYFPADDALMHAAKAVCGKAWPEILVMREEFSFDPHHGWHCLLSLVHRVTHADTYMLVVLPVAICFLLFAIVPMLLLQRPESWFMAVGTMALADPQWPLRLLLGRPHVVVAAVFAGICLTWRMLTRDPPPRRYMLLLCCVLAVMGWLVPTSAFVLCYPLPALVLAREWRAAGRFFACAVVGGISGFILSGRPVQAAKCAWQLLVSVPDTGVASRLLAGELQPAAPPVLALAVVPILLLWRAYRGEWSVKAVDNPILAGAAFGAVLGHLTGRLWTDWGMVAIIAWMAGELDGVLKSRFGSSDLKRLLVCFAVGATFVVVISADIESRWTSRLPRRCLRRECLPEPARGWYPDSGGIVYSNDMLLFYEMFFQNPYATWRYMLGFEPTLMPAKEQMVLREIQWNRAASFTFEPWVQSMRSADRMFLRWPNAAFSPLNRLDWLLLNDADGLCIGRPRRSAVPAEVRSGADGDTSSPTPAKR